MTKNTVVVREFPGGGPASGETIDIRLEADDSLLETGSTSADGAYTYDPNGSPGPWYWEIDTGDTVRRGSTLHCGSGGSYSLAEIPIALRALGTGVIDGYLEEMSVADEGTAKQVRINTGAILVNGIIAVWNTDELYTVATATDASNTKKCYVGVEVTGVGQATEGKAVIKDYCGTAAASPVLPTLTAQQTEASWFEPLGSFTLGITAAIPTDSITGMTDVRRYALTRNPTVTAIARRTDPTSEGTITSTTPVTSGSITVSPTLLAGVTYDITAQVVLLVKAEAGQTISMAPFIGDTTDIATFVSINSTDYRTIANAHSRSGVVGTGSPVQCAMRTKVSGGTGTYTIGHILVVAIPRS